MNLSIAWMLGLLTLLQAAPAPSVSSATTIDHSTWDALLKLCVHEEKVDYIALRDRYHDRLKAYLDSVGDIDPESLSRDEQLALYINLYNAWMIELIVERYRPDLSPTDGKGAIWDEPRIGLGGKLISLNTLEHELIRKQLKEPRAHAALVCAALSCPALSTDAYTADKIESQLDRAIRSWLNDPKRNVVDRENRQLRLSKIFRWYAADFGGADQLSKFAAQYLGDDVRDFSVSFLQYDWRLNDLSTAGRTDAISR
ncbi:DUF547 domain-containing protein [soil metagenome]